MQYLLLLMEQMQRYWRRKILMQVYFRECYGCKIILEIDLDAYKLRCQSENAGKIKKGTETHVDAYHKPVGTNRCTSFFGDSE